MFAMLRNLAMLVLIALLGLTGCVQRTISITSSPSGALVHLNDEEVGRTPVTVPYLYYGTYDVRLQLDGYQPLWTAEEAIAPWWEAPGPDLIAEAVSDAKVEQNWHYEMQLQPLADEGPLVDRALDMRDQLHNPRPLEPVEGDSSPDTPDDSSEDEMSGEESQLDSGGE